MVYILILINNIFFKFSFFKTYFITKFLSYYSKCFRIQPLVHCHHDTQCHACWNDICRGNIHHSCYFANCNKFSHFQGFTFSFHLSQLFFRFLSMQGSFISSVLRSLRFGGLPLKFFKGFSNLLLYFLVRRLFFFWKSWTMSISSKLISSLWTLYVFAYPFSLSFSCVLNCFLLFRDFIQIYFLPCCYWPRYLLIICL